MPNNLTKFPPYTIEIISNKTVVSSEFTISMEYVKNRVLELMENTLEKLIIRNKILDDKFNN